MVSLKSPVTSALLWGFFVFVSTPLSSRASIDPSSVLIVVNDQTPPEAGTGSKGASQFVADYYAAARGIPASNIVHTATRIDGGDPRAWSSWNISWQDFTTRLRGPIRGFLWANRTTLKIVYIVTTYGVPSHIQDHPSGIAGLSVDSFLANLFGAQADQANVPNPVYQPDPTSTLRLRHWVNKRPFYVVGRLDGPTPLTATGLVDKALAAERGISRKSGVGYFDWRHWPVPSPGDPASAAYYQADQTVLNGYALCGAAGLDCDLNDQTVTGGMITSAPNTLWAWGWYSGANVNDVYSFVTGAVGAQLTSYTANSIRTQVAGAWVPLWLERGVTATWGATAEPYVEGYANGDNLLNHMWNGFTFGDASYLACPTVGWMMVFVGDPLYAPKFID